MAQQARRSQQLVTSSRRFLADALKRHRAVRALELSPLTFAFVWVNVVGAHLLCAAFLTCCAATYSYLTNSIMVYFVQLWSSSVGGIYAVMFALASALHGIQVLQLLYRSLQERRLTFRTTKARRSSLNISSRALSAAGGAFRAAHEPVVSFSASINSVSASPNVIASKSRLGDSVFAKGAVRRRGPALSYDIRDPRGDRTVDSIVSSVPIESPAASSVAKQYLGGNTYYILLVDTGYQSIHKTQIRSQASDSARSRRVTVHCDDTGRVYGGARAIRKSV
ncbi:hypothetical protein ON010_g7698 [Phytophthora cinnamomi]|nr:hypothetical protein ON010_g7698 [Phytophthora cinnamomi]